MCILLLLTLKRHSDDVRPEPNAPHGDDEADDTSTRHNAVVEPQALPAHFYAFAVSCALGTLGLMTFGVISYHLVEAGLVATAVVTLLYAAAMATEAVAPLATGFAYGRWGSPILYTLPALIVTVPVRALAHTWSLVLAGVLIWGAVTGVQDSTVKALVADLVPQRRLATAYGVFAAFQGVAALAGGTMAGGLYTDHRTLLIALVAVAQALSAALLAVALRHRRAHPPS